MEPEFDNEASFYLVRHKLCPLMDFSVSYASYVFRNQWQLENYKKTIIISGKTLRMIMKKTAHFGVNNYLRKSFRLNCSTFFFDQSEAWNLNRLQTDCHEKWNYHNAFFFAGTLATTIGYGNNAPETKTGKIFCLVFILIGKLNAKLFRLSFKLIRPRWRSQPLKSSTNQSENDLNE